MFLLILPPETVAQIALPPGHQATPLALDQEILQSIAVDLNHWIRRVRTIVSAACHPVCPTHLINLCSRAQWQPQIRWQQRRLAAGFATELPNITPADVMRGLAAEVTKLCMQCR